MSEPEYHDERTKGPEKPPSVFEKPRESWDKKTDVQEYARRERAHFVGKLVLAVEIGRDGEKGEKEKGEPKDLKKAFREGEVALEGLHGKKLALEQTRGDLANRFEDFRQAEKVMGHALKPFDGEKRDLLFAALDHELNPEMKHGKPLAEDDQQKFGEALADLDSRTAPEKRQGMHMAAYIHLKQERVFEAEDQLNGTREQALAREMGVANSETAVREFLQSQPELSRSLTEIMNDRRRTDDQKVRAIDRVLSAVSDPKQKGAIEGYVTALAQHSESAPELERRIRSGELNLRNEKESIVRLQELSEQEQAMLRLPEDEAAEMQEASLERHDIQIEERKNTA